MNIPLPPREDVSIRGKMPDNKAFTRRALQQKVRHQGWGLKIYNATSLPVLPGYFLAVDGNGIGQLPAPTDGGHAFPTVMDCNPLELSAKIQTLFPKLSFFAGLF